MSTRKLSKTEQAILERAHKLPDLGVYAEMYGGKGPSGGRISGGVREYRAVCRLIRDGLLVLTKTDRSMLAMGNGCTVHIYSIRAKLTQPEQR
jgi:hypothetical protein